FLNNEDQALVELAALALGESKNETALEPLTGVWAGAHDDEMKQVLIQAIAMLRCEGAFEFILDTIESDYGHVSELALKTALLHYHDDKSREAIAKAVENSDNPVLQSIFKRESA
ncbi:MAG: hypothetical protein JXR97_11130, partial [Planctomycetes bacterium]|nr:hypothetical protein [Planctomycetota bacterium]